MWFAFDGHSFETFNTEVEARKHADSAMDDWSDDAGDGGWDELSTQVCYGKVTHSVWARDVEAEPHEMPDGCDSVEEHTLEPEDDPLPILVEFAKWYAVQQYEYHACTTGDCPHSFQDECSEGLVNEFMAQRKAKS